VLKKNEPSSNHLNRPTFFHQLRTLTKSTFTDTLTMNQFKDMPPLSPGETPWADHEVQLRAVLSGAEETPPEGLEARIWDALDAHSLQSTTNRAPWVAAAVAGSIVVASLWMASGDEMQEPEVTAPVEVSTEQVVDPVQQPVLREVSDVTPSQEDAVEQQPLEEANEASHTAIRMEEEVAERQKLEVMTGLESSAIPAKLDLNRTPIQSSQNPSDTVRLKGTLKLKQ
jgi:hypothetical protein